MKNYSLLGLALVGASGVTAAFIPAKKAEAKEKSVVQGWLQLTTASGVTDAAFTCTEVSDGTGRFGCSYTVTGQGSSTSITNVITHSDTDNGTPASYTATGTTADA